MYQQIVRINQKLDMRGPILNWSIYESLGTVGLCGGDSSNLLMDLRVDDLYKH